MRSDLERQRADKAYATRAGANNVHFLLPRMSDDPLVDMQESVKEGSELNAIGVWVRAHLAHELASGRVAPEAVIPRSLVA